MMYLASALYVGMRFHYHLVRFVFFFFSVSQYCYETYIYRVRSMNEKHSNLPL